MNYRFDLQTHTNRSPDCGWMRPERLVEAAVEAGLDGVAVTDHNRIDGVEAAMAAAPVEFSVIPGIEVDTNRGQLIGLFVSEPIEPYGSPIDIADQIHDQGGLVLVPHPFDSLREALLPTAADAAYLDLVEVVNSRCIRTAYNDRSRRFASRHSIPMTGGSDAHFPGELGTAYTLVDAIDNSLANLHAALATGSVHPAGGRGSLVYHAATKLVKLRNARR